MKGTIVSDLQAEIAFTYSNLTTPDRTRNLANGLIGPIHFVVNELDVFDTNHVIVAAGGIASEVFRVFRKDGPSPRLPLERFVLYPLMWHDYLESVVFHGGF